MAIKRFTKRAFTLVELLISTTIVALAAAALYSVFANGIIAWRQGNRDRTYARTTRLISEKMDRDLRNSFQFSELAFEGEDDYIAFPALVWVEPEEGSEETEGCYQLGRIAYFYDRQKDALCKEEKTFIEVSQDDEIGEGQVLIEQVRDVQFEYCYLNNATEAYDWKDDWKEEDQDSIPRAIRVEIAFQRKTGIKDKYNKTIFLPVGTGEQKIELGTVTETVVPE